VEHLELTVTEDSAGSRLDKFLASSLADRSRTQIQRLIKDGLVLVGTRPGRPNTIVRDGDRVSVEMPDPLPTEVLPEALPLTILFEDEDLVVVDKPAGMVVHPAAGHSAGTLVNALLHHASGLSGIGGELRPGIVHRLDKGTSGVMVVAKNDRAHEELARQFRDREVDKEYIALVWGVVQAGRRIDAPIGRDPVHRQKMSARARRARSAVTRVIRALHLKSVSLLHVAIQTGRTHQIRVHLSAIGHPIVGDTLYGGVRRHLPGHLRAIGRLERPFLHAHKLAFNHPRDGKRLTFACPLPGDLSVILDEIPAE
jgi:23S rRNA pseudouridine1911/1915/1917 synthase